MDEPAHIGDYVVLRHIGAGGMGTVYEATHRVTGGRFALKTLQPATTHGSVEGIRALRREVEVLANLDHPHIVKVVDFDLDADPPWFAMEFIEGRPLSRWHASTDGTASSADTIREVASRTSAADWSALHDVLEAARTKVFRVLPGVAIRAVDLQDRVAWEPDATLRTRLSWLGQLARALQFLHGEGLVHGDVKPDNVLVRDDGRAVLADFGLVSRIGRRVTADELRRARTQAQTLEYAAPERLLTSTFDSRADLYAVGCMLFETFAGVPPFTGSPPAVAIAHVSQPPPLNLLDELAQPPPPALRRLIAELLEKAPTHRTPYAAHVCAVLEDHGIATTSPTKRLPPSRPYLHRPALVGLQDEVARAKEAAYEVRRGDGAGRIDVVGRSGSGKSRLILEIMHHARGVGFDVHMVEAVEDVSYTLPFTGFMPVLHDLVDRAATERWSPSGGAVWLARLEPRLERWLDPGQRETLAQLRAMNPADVNDATARALASVLRELSGDRPIMLLAEQSDQLDTGSRRVLELIEEGSVAGRWLIVTSATAPRADSAATAIELPPLRAEQVASLAAQMFGALALDDGLVDLLNDVCERRPGPLVEFVHALVEMGLVEQDRRGGWRGRDGITLLQACEKLRESSGFEVGRRVALLPDELRAVGGAAACLGRQFDLSDLVGVLNQPADVYLAVNELLRLGFLVETERPTSAARDELSFTTDETRRAFYEGCDGALRQTVHLRASELLEGRADPAVVARHLQGAGESEKAFRAWLEAAEQAKRRCAHRVRAEYLASAVRVADWLAPSERERLLVARFEAIGNVGTTDEAMEEAAALLTGVATPARRAELLLHLVRRAFMSGFLDDMAPHRDELERAANGADTEARVHANVALATLEAALGHYEVALQHNQRAYADAPAVGDRELLFDVLSRLAWSNCECGHPEVALQQVDEAGLIAAELGLPELASANRTSRAVMQMAMGLYRDARPFVRENLDLARRAQLPRRRLIGTWNLAVADLYSGAFDRIVPAMVEMEELRREMALADDYAPYLGVHGRALSYLGDHDAAIRLVANAVACAASEVERTAQQMAFVQVLLNAGRVDDAVEQLQLLPPEESVRREVGWALLAGRVAAATGDLDTAEEQFLAALELARGRELHTMHVVTMEQARLRRRQGRAAEAVSLLEQALSWFDDQEHLYNAALVRLELAELLPGRAEELLASVDAYIASQPFEPDAELVRRRRVLGGRG